MELAREEIFGPVLSLIHVDTLDEAIEAVNGSRFGNGVSIFTESGAAVRRFKHDVEAGMVGVNIGVAAPVAFFPFSGWKDSFLGDLHAHGTDAVDFYTRKKTVTSRYFSSGESGSYFVETLKGHRFVRSEGFRRGPARRRAVRGRRRHPRALVRHPRRARPASRTLAAVVISAIVFAGSAQFAVDLDRRGRAAARAPR